MCASVSLHFFCVSARAVQCCVVVVCVYVCMCAHVCRRAHFLHVYVCACVYVCVSRRVIFIEGPLHFLCVRTSVYVCMCVYCTALHLHCATLLYTAQE